jgi:hypothetical protein
VNPARRQRPLCGTRPRACAERRPRAGALGSPSSPPTPSTVSRRTDRLRGAVRPTPTSRCHRLTNAGAGCKWSSSCHAEAAGPRYGDPVRARQNTASMTSRWSAQRPPGGSRDLPVSWANLDRKERRGHRSDRVVSGPAGAVAPGHLDEGVPSAFERWAARQPHATAGRREAPWAAGSDGRDEGRCGINGSLDSFSVVSPTLGDWAGNSSIAWLIGPERPPLSLTPSQSSWDTTSDGRRTPVTIIGTDSGAGAGPRSGSATASRRRSEMSPTRGLVSQRPGPVDRSMSVCASERARSIGLRESSATLAACAPSKSMAIW